MMPGRGGDSPVARVEKAQRKWYTESDSKKGAKQTKTEIYVFGAAQGQTEACVHRAVRTYLKDDVLQLPPILRKEHGKPYFADEKMPCFSVSHSGAYLVCAVSACGIGVDLQQTVLPKNRVAERFFHPEEAEYVKKGGQEAFFEVWTAKESYVKYTGRGIDGGFSHFSTVENGRLRRQLNGAYLQPVALADGYRMCLCTSRPTSVRVIFVEE